MSAYGPLGPMAPLWAEALWALEGPVLLSALVRAYAFFCLARWACPLRQALWYSVVSLLLVISARISGCHQPVLCRRAVLRC